MQLALKLSFWWGFWQKNAGRKIAPWLDGVGRRHKAAWPSRDVLHGGRLSAM